ncbi:MAG: asparagine synthase (glutamine-hydrolyzing) [Nitrospirota bacterium]
MCGICGFAGFRDDALLARMNGRLVHRGPDDEGVYLSETVSLAMRRLSIIDLAGGRQPMHNEDKTVWVVFNGEIYNFQELRDALIAKGHAFATRSDTEVIVHLYEEHGEDFVRHLRGMFAIALADTAREKVILARDRLGIKPLYYLAREGRLLFASELKALLEWPGASRTLDPQALLAYLTFLYVPSPMAIFAGIKKLPPGHLLIHRRGDSSVRRYWDVTVPDAGERGRRPEEYVEEIRARLTETVKRHLISDVPLGLFLSGGLDSGALAAVMARLSAGPVKSFSIGYGREAASFDELDAARLIARHVGSDHREFRLKPDIMELLPELVYHLDEPFADSSMIPTYLISKAARSEVTVALTGIGGDELFAGYPRYLGVRLAAGYERLPEPARRAAVHLAAWLPESRRSRNLAGRIKRFLAAGLLPPRERYLSWISFFHSSDVERFLTKDFMAQVDPGRLWASHRQFYDAPSAAVPLDRALYLDVNTYLADDLLMLGDKMSMAASLELRVPYCDHTLVEFAATIPGSVKMRHFRLKALFRDAIRGWLPGAILARKKQGFMVPMGQWLRRELKPLARELLSEAAIRKRGYFNPAAVAELAARHESGRQNLSDQLFALMTLELWHRVYIDGTAR